VLPSSRAVVRSLLLLLPLGCSDPSGAGDASIDAVPTEAGLDVTTVDSGSSVIGPAGGAIFAAGVSLTVAPGALAAPTTITITRTDLFPPAGYEGYSPVWRFSPEGLTFASPASIEVAFVGDAARAGLYWSRAGGGYERLPGAVSDGRVVARVSHFSTGFVGTLLPGPDASVDASIDASIDASVDASIDASIDAPAADAAAIDVPTATVAAARPVAPLSGAHVPSRRPGLRWTLPAGATGARVTLCRDRALTEGSLSFDALGTGGAPASDLAPGVWFWSLRGMAGPLAGSVRGPAWRMSVASTTTATARPWGADHDVNGDGVADFGGVPLGAGLSYFLGGASGPVLAAGAPPLPFDATDYGRSVAFLGDVDGDGYGDVAIGAPGSDGVYVYRGGPTGLLVVPWVVTGARGSRLGAALAGPGDMNGDGFADIVAARATAGLVFIPGGASGPGAPVVMSASGAGVAVVLREAGDVDGDGHADVIQDNRLYFGGPAGFDPARAGVEWMLGPVGDVNGDGFADVRVRVAAGGSAVRLGASSWPGVDRPMPTAAQEVNASAGDYNRDGFSDVLVGDELVAVNAAGLASTAVRIGPGVGGIDDARPAGDLDGDGYEDALATAPGAYVWARGTSSGLPVIHSASFDLPDPMSSLLPTYAPAGDVNGDGRGDLAISSDVGISVRVHHGTATGIAPTASARLSVSPSTRISASGGGDVNGDGFDDLVIVADGTFVPSARSLSLGSASGSSTTLTPLGNIVQPRIVGDLNHDGFDDLAVSSPGVGIRYGRATGVDPTATPLIGSPPAGITYGAAGDINHDGYGDLLVQPSPTAAAQIYRGSATGVVAAPFATLGAAGVATAVGDVNGDGFDDVAVTTSSGVSVFHGSATGLGAAPSSTFAGARRVLPFGDVDRDGYDDVATHDARVGTEEFSTWSLHRGSPAGATVAPWLRRVVYDFTDAPGIDFEFVTGLGGFGDLDGDGTRDVVSTRTFLIETQLMRDLPASGPREVAFPAVAAVRGGF
jgi:hypothetical protein